MSAPPEPFQEEGEFHLFPLRRELRLLEAPRTGGGGKEWTIQDPFRQQFYRIGWQEFTILANWKEGMTPEELCGLLKIRQDVEIEPQVIKNLHDFLLRNELLTVEKQEYTKHLYETKQKSKTSVLKKALHQYLFFRVPLLKPDKFLEHFLPYVQPLGSSYFYYVVFLFAGAGLYLISRQWESFWQTFLYFFNFSGMIWYGVVLIFVKFIHELAHAFTAKHFGLRVPTMGVAFLVLMPVLYTDVTDAWKLTSRRSRLQVTASGMIAELALAVLATFLWSFLPEGTFKSMAFLVATVTWIMAAMINFNFILKFDGYYFLSDLLEVPNLQDRAFALARWLMREKLFAIGAPEPEKFPRGKRTILLSYAYFTWVYRAILFLGIAVMVYYVFFKVLGIFLMIVELAWFLGLPIWNEMKAWYKMKEKITWNPVTRRNAIIGTGLILLLLFPWQGTIKRSAYLKPEEITKIFLPEAGIIQNVAVKEKQRVAQGDTLVTATSHQLEYEIKQSESKVKTLQWYLDRKESNEVLIGQSNVARQQLIEETTKLQGLKKRLNSLTITASFDGIVSDLDNSLNQGSPVGTKMPILSLYNDESIEITTFLPEEDLKRIEVGGTGKFYPNHIESGVFDVEIVEIEESSNQALSQPWLASLYGGDVAVKKSREGKLESHESVYRVRLKVTSKEFQHPPFMLRGSVKLDAERRSIIGRFFRGAMYVLIRESSF